MGIQGFINHHGPLNKPNKAGYFLAKNVASNEGCNLQLNHEPTVLRKLAAGNSQQKWADGIRSMMDFPFFKLEVNFLRFKSP